MIDQYRAKTVPELQALVKSWKAELLALRFQQAIGKVDKPHKFRELRVSVARALTVIAEKQRAEAKGEAAPAAKSRKQQLAKKRKAKPTKAKPVKAKPAKATKEEAK